MHRNWLYQIFRLATVRIESTRTVGIWRICLGISAILLPYPLLSLYQPYAWAGWLMYYTCALGLLCGLGARVSAAILGILLLGTTNSTNGLASLILQAKALGIYLILAVLLPLSHSFSLWRLRFHQRKQKPPRERGNLWALNLVRIQTVVFLCGDGISRIHPSFFSGERIEQILLYNLGQSDPTPFLKYSGVTALLGIASVCLPIVGSLLLWRISTRLYGLLCILLYALLLQILLPQTLWVLLILTSILAFLDPVYLHRWLSNKGHNTQPKNKIT